jgi:hypothetical protein
MARPGKEAWRLWIAIRDRSNAPYLALSVASLIYHVQTPVPATSIHYRERKTRRPLTITEPTPSYPWYQEHNRANADLDNGHIRTIPPGLGPITQLTWSLAILYDCEQSVT